MPGSNSSQNEDACADHGTDTDQGHMKQAQITA